MTGLTPKQGYLPYVDGMRALAVLAVVLYHLNPLWLPGGFAGVDIFFVISGFVVTASMARVPTDSFAKYITYFYARRIQRIVPALVVCLVVVSILSALFIPNAWLSNKNSATGLAAFFGLSNMILAMKGNDYFSPTAEFNPFTHTWSLAVEEQFYIIFPLLFFPWLVFKARKISAGVIFAVFAVISLLCAYALSRINTTWAFYLVFSRFWELAAGVLLYKFLQRRQVTGLITFSAPVRTAGLTISILLLAIAFVYSQPLRFSFPGAVPAVLGTLGLLCFMYDTSGGGSVKRLFTLPLVIFIGKISYSLYLWHWPVFVLFKWTIGLDSWLPRVIAVLLSFAAAILSFAFVETKIRERPFFQRQSKPRLVLAGLALIGVGFTASAASIYYRPALSLSTVARNSEFWYPVPLVGGCEIEPGQVSVGGIKRVVLSSKNCPSGADSSLHIFAVGDSHTEHFSSLFRQYARESNVTVTVYADGGCAFLKLTALPPAEGACGQAEQDKVMADVLKQSKKGDVLLLSSLRLRRYGDQWANFEDPAQWNENFYGVAAQAARRASEEQAVEILKKFHEKGMHIVLTGPTPVFKFPNFRCADWFNRMNSACAFGDEIPKSEVEKGRATVFGSYERIMKEVPDIAVWDPFPLLCPGSTCKISKDGKPLYFDADHLSAYSNSLLLPSFTQFMATEFRKQAS